MRYDLHIHSCLSPCADREMTPATIAGLCALNEADVIAIADHNSARNLPAAEKCCKAYGVQLLPALEANTAEEIHLLCYFPTVAAALAMGDTLYESLPEFDWNPDIWGPQWVMNEDDEIIDQLWGPQWVMNEDDEIIDQPKKLLTAAAGLTLEETARLCRELGGVPVPAHIDRDSYSLLSVLGLWPEEPEFSLAELADPDRAAALTAAGLVPPSLPFLTGSDAHCLEALRTEFPLLAPDCPLRSLLK